MERRFRCHTRGRPPIWRDGERGHRGDAPVESRSGCREIALECTRACDRDHVVEFFGLLGGGKGDGDMGGLPPSALAVLPATTHAGWVPPHHGIITRTERLLPITNEFLDSPDPRAL